MVMLRHVSGEPDARNRGHLQRVVCGTQPRPDLRSAQLPDLDRLPRLLRRVEKLLGKLCVLRAFSLQRLLVLV